jgi:hypothetical protein
MRKGQSSIEYLATYGWALLILLTVLSLLAYYGFIDARALAPDRCDLGAEFSCNDFGFAVDDTQDPDEVTLRMFLKNNLPERVTINTVNCEIEQVAGTGPGGISIGSQEEAELTCTIASDSVASRRGKIKGTFNFEYNKKDKPFSHEIDGTVFGPKVGP